MKCDEWRKKATHRVTIEELSDVSGDYGGFTSSWSTQSTVWAAIEPMSGREVFSQNMQQSLVNTKITIRYQSDLKDTGTTSALRVNYDGRLFPVRYLQNLSNDMKQEGSQFQIMYCEENAPTEEG